MSPTTDIDSQASAVWNSGRQPSLVWELTHHRVTIEGRKVIDHNSGTNHAYGLPQNIHVVAYLFEANDKEVTKVVAFVENGKLSRTSI